MSDQSSPPPAPASAPRRGFLRFLFRTPLGLLLVLLLAVGVAVLLAPTVASGLAPGLASDWFGERYHGRLQVGQAKLAWFGEQTLEGVQLADPSGAPIARADVRLPGLWALATGGGKRIGKVVVVAEASLEADANGKTNLDAALEPRAAPPESPPESPEDAGGAESRASLRELEVELDVRVTKLSWSDERTRALGAPFVLQDVALACTVRPGEPLAAQLRGVLSGGASGSLSLDARIEHPFDPPSSVTPPSADVSATIEHFPVALADALARQGGKLQGLFGEELSLYLTAKGTLQQGSFDLRLDAPLAKVRAAATLEGGVLRSEGDGITAEFDLKDEFLEPLVRPLLAPGARLVRLASPVDPVHTGDTGGTGDPVDTGGTSATENGADAPRVGLAVAAFEVPLGAYLESSAQEDGEAALAALLAGTRARWSVRGGDWSYQDPVGLPGRGPVLLSAVVGEGELAAPEAESRVRLAFRASNAAAQSHEEAERNTPAAVADRAFASVELVATWQGGAALAAFAPDSALAPVHVVATAEDWPTGLADVLAQANGDLSRALGARVGLAVDATVQVEAAPGAGLDWTSVGTRWRELARRVTANCSLDLRGNPKGEGLAALGGAPFSLNSLGATLALAPAKPLDVQAHAEYATASPGRLQLTASVADLFADEGAKTPLGFDVQATATALPVGVAGALSGQGAKLEQLLGAALDLAIDAQGTLAAGTANLALTGEHTQVRLAGRLQAGTFTDEGGPALSMTLAPEAALLDGLLAGSLPAGTRFGFTGGRGAIGVEVQSLSLPVQELLDAAVLPAGRDELLATLLSKTRCEARVDVGLFAYQDASLAASGKQIERLALQLGLRLAPEGALAPLVLELQATSPSFGPSPIVASLTAPHAPRLLGVATGGDFEPLAVRASFTDLSTALLDAYAGGTLAQALGPKVSLDLVAELEQGKGTPFAGRASCELTGANGTSKVVLAAHAEDPLNVRAAPAERRPAGVPPELEATLDVTGAGALFAFAPADARELLRELCGETVAAKFKLASTSADATFADVTLDAGGITLDGAADYRSGVLTSVAERPIALSVAPTPAVLARLLAGRLPEGASLELAEGGGALTVELRGLSVPVGRFLAADPAVAKTELVDHTSLQLAAQLPTLVYTHPPAPPASPGATGATGATGAPGASGVPAGQAQVQAVITLRGVQLAAQLAPAAPATADLTGSVDATPPGAPGEIEAHVVVTKPSGFLSEPPAPGSRANLTAKLARFPSALVDVLARQDGLIVDVLGPELEMLVRGAYPESAGEPLHAELRSSLGEVLLTSRLEGGMVTSQGAQGLDAKVGLTPLFSKRIVGSLVPLFVQLRQDDPTKRTLLTGRNLALPLDGDLAKLSGDLVLDLGAVQYQLLPGLSQALSLAGVAAPGAKDTVVPPITIQVVKGVARYDRIPVKIGGREVNFRGTADLAQQSFELAFSVPLELLGSKVESKLEPLRDVLDPKMEVPLELYGAWTSPRVRLGKGFLEKALKQAGEGALERGLGELFGGGKKKKGG